MAIRHYSYEWRLSKDASGTTQPVLRRTTVSSSAGVCETYSGTNSQFTGFERIEKNCPMDMLLHTKKFMELCGRLTPSMSVGKRLPRR